MKRKKTRLNFKRIFLIIFFLVSIIACFFFVKHRFFIADDPVQIINNLVAPEPISSKYENIGLKDNPTYSGIRKM